MSNTSLSEQEQVRRNSLAELRKLGIDPYPAAEYKTNAFAKDIHENFSPEKNNYNEVSLAGRLMSRRIMGNASFAELMDSSGRIQIYVRRDDVCPGEDKTMYNTVFKHHLDIGDIIGVKGFVFRTQMGETTIHVKEFTLLSKSLHPLPIVKEKDGKLYDAVTDPEMRYRQRYVDLIINPDVREVFRMRTQIYQSMRELFNSRGYLEVETPVLQAIPGGAAARPFITHHNTLDIPLYLRIANELYLKRLIVGGYEGVYEFSKDFRNEGMDRTHNPEFTVMEIYIAYKDYNWMMSFTEQIISKVAMDLHGKTEITYDGRVISLKPPFKRISMLDSIKENTGTDISGMDEAELRNVCDRLGVEHNPAMGKGKLIDAIFSEKCEHTLVQPTFIIDYPTETSPLTKMHRTKPGLTERFELYINCREIANAYSELNDPIDQMVRFQDQLRLSEKGDDEAMFIDLDFVRALEYGMPPTSGMGMGMDRLVMLMTDQPSIQDVLFFPQMKPEGGRKAQGPGPRAKFLEMGIPEEWIDPLLALGYDSAEKLKEVNKPGRLANDLNGYKKKNKLDLPGLSPEAVSEWLA
ncbi:MAG: lysine--tRNA ligase [Bacteroidales bacterium]|nr:lysine--tRNA ligase [Bacteroidales bacterium]MBN2632466.1 lysine--tRNA ligase [Bacteroidales bacterium]